MDKVNLKTVPEILKEIKIEEEEYKIEVLYDYYGKADPFYLSNKDPKYHYRFLSIKDNNLLMKTGNLLFDKGGWQICQREHLKRIGLEDKIGPNGTYIVGGDLVLAFMPKELYAKKEAEKQQRTKKTTDAINRLINKGDSRIGGKEMHNSMKGIQTQKQLGM